MKKLSAMMMLLLVFPFLLGATSYNYTYWGEAIHSAPGMTYQTSIDISTSSPEDLVVFEHTVYIIDSDANALIMITEELQTQILIDSFVYDATFKQSLIDEGVDVTTLDALTLSGPLGIDVTENGIFICDTENHRIVQLDHTLEVVGIFDTIEDETFLLPGQEPLDENADKIYFEPKKITVDSTNRIYVVAKNAYEGILEINSDGSFNRFTGVNPVSLTPWDIMLRNIMTEEQIAQLQLFLPTEYTNVNIDDKNFIYATSKSSENNTENMIQLINPKGVDVIKKNGYFPPQGDVIFYNGDETNVETGPSDIVDIAITDNGIYTVLDQKRSRLFTYDDEGNLLYVDGDEGAQTDKFNEGVAVDYYNSDLLILDRGTKAVIVYTLTEFGGLVNKAIAHHNEGEFDLAAGVWSEVIKLNSNYEIAYNGIGKLLLRQGEYKSAMEHFKLGHDEYYYSKAFQEYRNEILKDNFGLIAGGVVGLVVLIIALRIRGIYKKGGSILYED